MIEFVETFTPAGGMTARLHATRLPHGMGYTVTLWPDGAVTAQSTTGSRASVRYYTHRTYAAALAHGFAWAQRKERETRAADKARRRRNSETIDAVVESIKTKLREKAAS